MYERKLKMKKLLFLLVFILALGGLTACTDSTATADEEKEYTETIKQQSLDAIGLPDVTNFFEMGQLKEIYEKRDNPKLICYWYTKNQMTGKYIYMGKCIGYGIPYSTQITAPTQGKNTSSSYGPYTVEQAEPNGLYSTGSTSATWILSIKDEKSEINPVYTEEEILALDYKLRKEIVEDFSITKDY
jgi:hypothetical protein